jgi:hypothetical protein
MNSLALILVLSATGVAGMGFVQDKQCEGDALYKVDFMGTWTAANHELGYPGDGPSGPNAHFSPLLAATFGYGDEFFKVGGAASPGVKVVAETGMPPTLIHELRDDSAYLDVQTAALAPLYSPEETMLMEPGVIKANTDHDYLGLITMIAPSPDWFTGAAMIELCDKDTGMWKEEIMHEAMAYDAGTDAGTTFLADNAPEATKMPISMVMCGTAFCEAGDTKAVASIKITKM